ncbi:MAG: glycosyltransferase, partial [Ectothiorhodospiraceae bacterium]
MTIVSPLGRGGGGSHGGITPFVLNLAAGMQAQGVGVELLCFYPEGADAVGERLPKGIALRVLEARNRRELRKRLGRYMRQTAHSRFLAAGHRFNDALLSAAVAEGTTARAYASVHNTISREVAGMGWIRGRRWLAAMRRQYARAAGVIAVSRGVAEDLVSLVPVSRERL